MIERKAKIAWSPSGDPYSFASIRLGRTPSTLDLISCRPGVDMQVRASVDEEIRFTAIDWGHVVDSNGLIATGNEHGQLALWNVDSLLENREDGSSRQCTTDLHEVGPLNSVEFHPKKSNLLVSGGQDGKVKIVDLSKPDVPQIYSPRDEETAYPAGIQQVSWNFHVPHIVGASLGSGSVLVWDLKSRQEIMSFEDPHHNRKISALCWSKQCATQIAIAFMDDQIPALQIWDLRNAKAPWKECGGHTKSVTALSWSGCDPNLFTSAGRDNRVITWSFLNGTPEIYADQRVHRVVHEVKWSRGITNVHALMSDSISLFVPEKHAINKTYEPAWNRIVEGQELAADFKGKLVTWDGTTLINSQITEDPEVIEHAKSFEDFLSNPHRQGQDYCWKHQAKDNEDHLHWALMSALYRNAPRNDLVNVLGFSTEEFQAKKTAFLGEHPCILGGTPLEETLPVQDIIDNTAAEDFFDSLAASPAMDLKSAEESQETEDLVDWSSGPLELIRKAIVMGDLKTAVEVSIKIGEYADALVIASAGDADLFKSARNKYLDSSKDSFRTTLKSIILNELEAVVQKSNLKDWRETLAILATYSGQEFRRLAGLLACRLENELFDPNAAVACYIAVGDFEGTIGIWRTAAAKQQSQKLELMAIVERMYVLHTATGFKGQNSFFSEKVFQYADLLTDNGQFKAALQTLDQLIPKDPIAEELRARLRRALQPAPAPSRPQQPISQASRQPAHSAFPPRHPPHSGFPSQHQPPQPGFPSQHQPPQPGPPGGFQPFPPQAAPVSSSPTFSRPEPPRPKPHARLPIRPNVAPQQENLVSAPQYPNSGFPDHGAPPVAQRMPPPATKLETYAPPKPNVPGQRFVKSRQLDDSLVQEIVSSFTNFTTHAPEPNARKAADNERRFQEFFASLRQSEVSETTEICLKQMVEAIQTCNYKELNAVLKVMLTKEWDANQKWLMAMKRVIGNLPSEQ